MQDYQSGADASFGLIPLLLLVGVYAYFAYCQARMAHKCGLADSAWWAWIPILNTFLLFKMANKPNWWFVLCLVPLVNIYIFGVLWWEAAKACKTSPVWGILTLVPLVNFVAIGIMAFSSPPAMVPPPHTPQPREPEHVG